MPTFTLEKHAGGTDYTAGAVPTCRLQEQTALGRESTAPQCTLEHEFEHGMDGFSRKTRIRFLY